MNSNSEIAGSQSMQALPVKDPTKVMVTGSSGFVGKHFCSTYGGIPLVDQGGAVDLRDAARVRSAVASVTPSAVLHLAAQSSVAQSFNDPLGTFAVNFQGTLNLLQALTVIGFEGVFVYVGSADTYGTVPEADLPVQESHLLRPRSPYAVSKVAAEALCYQWNETEKFRIVLTRPFNQIGPGQDIRFAVANFARQIVEIRKQTRSAVLLTGDLDVTRDFTDVRDTVRAYHLLLESGQAGEAYNICSGRERTLRSVLVSLLEIAGVEAELRVDPARLRNSEQQRMVGDPRKLHETTGWTAKIPLEKTLTDLLNKIEKDYS